MLGPRARRPKSLNINALRQNRYKFRANSPQWTQENNAQTKVELWIAFWCGKWYSIGMNNRERLEQIIDLETPLAEAGCLMAQSLVINAQAELDELDRKEKTSEKV